jgi:hypothetical protein
MDSTHIYSQTLSQLGETLVKMTSPEWDDLVHSASTEQRQAAARLMIQTQHARLALGNAVLQDIADELKRNEADLTAGIDALEDKLAALSSVAQVLNTLASFLTIVGRIVSLV